MKWELSYPNIQIDGNQSIEHEQFIVNAIPDDLKGKTVLDLAAWDGYYSYVAWSRGAKAVVAIDLCEAEIRTFDSSPEGLYDKYRFIKDKTGVDINFIPMDAYDIDKIKMKFDIIFCFGLYYHVNDIYGLFEKIYNQLNENGTVLIEGHISTHSYSVMYLNAKNELNDDPTNVWSPTEECLLKMLKRIGYKHYNVKDKYQDRILIEAIK